MDFQPAKTVDEWNTLMKSDSKDLIRFLDDWNSFKRHKQDLLEGIDEKIIEAFTEKPVFNNGGLAGARYDILADKLTFTQFETLFGYFGLSMHLFDGGNDDWRNYYCSSPGTCGSMPGFICTSNC
ncbi:hypothetical protein ACIQXF_10125 [Lysinibacillus sp. NPDC097231]|uniref:hypothetical protein n=1 Tax=Lysinibacillus sp. NPDC097231 TaxID=3364142 RepID=UPI0038227407